MTEIYTQEILPLKTEMYIPSSHSFLEWHADGCKYAALAAGGTIYLLVLIAGLGARVCFCLAEDETVSELANVLRQPDEGTLFVVIACV